MELISQYSEILAGILGFVIGCGVTVTVQRLRLGTNSTLSNQSGSSVKGDQAGRDIRNR